MSREKWLWGLCVALAAVAAILAVMLVQATSAKQAAPANEGAPVPAPGGGSGAQNVDSPSERRVIAQAGGTILYEDEFAKGLRELFGPEFVRYWMKQTVVRLEAQARGIQVTRADIDEELRRMQVGYESSAEFYRVMREQLGLTEQALRNDALNRLQLEGIATAAVVVTEADVEKYIEENPEEFAPMQDVRYAQIIVDTKERVELVLDRLAQGAPFELLARDVSTDAATASAGGDSGWVPADDPFILPEIAAAITKLGVGDVSPPIPLEDGQWAVLTLLGRRTINPLDDSGVRAELRRELALAAAPSLFEVETMLLEKYDAVDFLGAD